MSTTPDAGRTSLEYATGEQVVWGSVRKVGFRALFCYVFLFGIYCVNLASIVNIYFLTGRIPASPLDRLWGIVVSLVARYIFHLRDFAFQAVTSGDSLSDYLQFLTYAAVSLLVTLVWSLLRRKTTNYSQLNQWLRLYAQLALGYSGPRNLDQAIS